MTELDTQSIGEAVVRRLLAAVIGLDPVARQVERIERAAVARRRGSIDFGGSNAQAQLGGVNAVELAGQFGQRAVAVVADVGDDGAHRLLDVLRGLALGGEKSGKARGKIRRSAVETKGHRAVSGRAKPRVSPVN